MKKSNLTLLILIICTIFSCSKNDENSELNLLSKSTNSNVLEDFYDAQINNTVLFPNHVVSTNSYNQIDINLIQNEIVSPEIGSIINDTSRTISVYYIKDESTFSHEDILAFSMYQIDENDEMRHRFYLKNNNSYSMVLNLLEDFVSLQNQHFLVYKYLSNVAAENVIGVKNFNSTNDPNRLSRVGKQRNELEVQRVRYTYHKVGGRSSKYISDASAYDCGNTSVCGEAGDGVCDGGDYCDVGDPDDGVCNSEESEEIYLEKNLVSNEEEASNIANLPIQRRLRDEFLKSNPMGIKHLDYYNAISRFVTKSDYSIDLLIKMIGTVPNVNSAISTFLDNPNNAQEVIMDTDLNNEINIILEDFKLISENEDYIFLLNDFQSDLSSLTNLNKTEIITASNN